MSTNVTYIDAAGKRYDAEIIGPAAEIHKPVLKKIGKHEHEVEVVKPGSVVLKIGTQKVNAATKDRCRTRPYVNLRVNFGDEAHPRYGSVSGVRLKDERDVTFGKDYYELKEDAPKADKGGEKSKEPKADKGGEKK